MPKECDWCGELKLELRFFCGWGLICKDCLIKNIDPKKHERYEKEWSKRENEQEFDFELEEPTAPLTITDLEQLDPDIRQYIIESLPHIKGE